MNKNVEVVANAIIEEMNIKNLEWCNFTYKLIVMPSESVSYEIQQEIFDNNLNLIEGEFIRISDFDLKKKMLFLDLNKHQIVNKIIFNFKNKLFVNFEYEFDQSIIDKYYLYLPRSKKGTIKPWYQDNWLTPIIEKVPKTSDKYQNLPLASIVFDTENLTYDKAFLELNKLVNFSNDTMWDGGHYNIKYCNETWTAEGGLYLYETIEDKEDNNVEEVFIDMNVTEEIKALFIFIQKEYAKFNPKVPFDSLFVTVQFDSTFTRNFELNGVEVYPDAPAMPDVLDANYFMQNLFNCLVINAPTNFEWAIYTITRKRLENGSTESSGKYYYSVNEDKTDLNILNPGEEIFMMNVTERLMDEFLEKDLKDFETVVFHYNKNGKASFNVLKRSDFKW